MEDVSRGGQGSTEHMNVEETSEDFFDTSSPEIPMSGGRLIGGGTRSLGGQQGTPERIVPAATKEGEEDDADVASEPPSPTRPLLSDPRH
jgi:hypothetical protein